MTGSKIGLLVTLAFSGTADVAAAGRGMIAGAVGFTAYCLAAVLLIRAWGAWRGSAAALVVWAAVATAAYQVAAR